MTYHPSQYVNKTNIYQPGEYLKVVGLVSEKKTDTETNAATIKDHPLPLPTIYNGTEDASTSYLKFKN